MDHLTNLYKHKCEQLQEKINHLNKLLLEVNETEYNGTGNTPPPTVIRFNATPAGKDIPDNMKPVSDTWIQPFTSIPPWAVIPKFPPPNWNSPLPKPKYQFPRDHDPNGTPLPLGVFGVMPENPYPIGSPEWVKWYFEEGHWHINNPYTYGSPAWFRWESNPKSRGPSIFDDIVRNLPPQYQLDYVPDPRNFGQGYGGWR